MWNSNSLISWLIVRSGLDIDAIHPPAGVAPRAGMLGSSSPAVSRWVREDEPELALPLRIEERELEAGSRN